MKDDNQGQTSAGDGRSFNGPHGILNNARKLALENELSKLPAVSPGGQGESYNLPTAAANGATQAESKTALDRAADLLNSMSAPLPSLASGSVDPAVIGTGINTGMGSIADPTATGTGAGIENNPSFNSDPGLGSTPGGSPNQSRGAE